MADFQRDAHVAKIHAVKTKMEKAGVIHRKDLGRQLRKLENELREYDKWHKSAGR